MSYDVAITKDAGFHRVTVTGTPSFDQMLAFIHLLGVRSSTWPDRQALVDLRGVETMFSPEEQFRIGQEAAASLPHMRKIASVVPTHRITHISEKAARREGTNVTVFVDEAAAVAWLQEPRA